MREFVIYTVARVAVFGVCFGLVLGLFSLGSGPVNLVWPVIVAAVLSMIVSLYALKDLRAQFVARVHEKATRATTRFEEMRSSEDAD